MLNKETRNYAYDLLRIFCCLSIICLHVSGHLSWASKYNLLVQGIVRPCLTTFMTLSGYYVLSKPIVDIKAFYLKKIFFLAFPLVIYAALYQFVPSYISDNDFLGAIRQINVISILKTDICGHFWFVYSLIGLYLATPFLQKMLSALSNKQFVLLLALIFYVERIFPIISQYNIPALKVDTFPFTGTFVFFYILGFFIRRNEHIINAKIKLVIIVVGLLNIPFMAYMLTKAPFAATLCNLSLCTIIGTIFYFVFFSVLPVPEFIGKTVLFFSKRTFSIYLLHMLVFNTMTQMSFMNLTAENKMYMLGIKVFAIFFICDLICSIIDLLIINPVIWLYNQAVDSVLEFFKKLNRNKNIC